MAPSFIMLAVLGMLTLSKEVQFLNIKSGSSLIPDEEKSTLLKDEQFANACSLTIEIFLRFILVSPAPSKACSHLIFMVSDKVICARLVQEEKA